MKKTSPKRTASPSLWLLVPVLMGALLVGACSGDTEEPDPSSNPQTSQERPSQPPQQQGQPGQIPQRSQRQTLSSSDVTDEQIQKAARIAVSAQLGSREDRMQMQKDMREKYGNPEELDSTQMAKAQKELRRRQMEMKKKQAEIVRKEAKEEGMTMQMFTQIMRSAQQDSTLRTRLQTAMKTRMKDAQTQTQQTPNP